MKRRTVILSAGAVVILIQLIPVARTNPTEARPLQADPAVMAVLKRSCFDCHSHETRWPWYSRVAPVSWLIAHDVNEARKEMNFSLWQDYEPKKQARLMGDVVELVEEGEMPPWLYVRGHPTARLAPDDVLRLRAWAGSTAEEADEE